LRQILRSATEGPLLISGIRLISLPALSRWEYDYSFVATSSRAMKKKPKTARTPGANSPKNGSKRSASGNGAAAGAKNGARSNTSSLPQQRTYSIPDMRLEKPSFSVRQVRKGNGEECCYEISGDLSAPAPPIRDSKYLNKQQCIEIYRWMVLNRKMEQALENLYKQGKVVGGVYFGLGQESCSCASAFALDKDDWVAPMIRNQGSLLVRGFEPRDMMMQYMAKAGSPTKGRDGTSHFGDIYERNVVSPISMLGDLIPVMAGVALGARLQGRNIAVMTYIGDGGESTGVTYEGINFAAVQKLGLVLLVESNLWAYSTPSEMQYCVEDLAERAIGYGIPGVIIDGTDACQVYDAAREAVERAHRGEGPTLIEAKMMRMKGHAIHDAADYVPKPMFEYWRRRDPIARFENYLVNVKKWLTPQEHQKLISDVEGYLEKEREIAVNSPMPDPASAEGGVYCEDGCHHIKPKYGIPKVRASKPSVNRKREEAAIHFK
jgi:TPP-dependent pyruvate/acetoin dehydrogenase alpha subunit